MSNITFGPWFVYRIECVTPHHVYIGQTCHLQERIKQHQKKKGSAFTRKYGVKSWRIVGAYRTQEAARRMERLHMGRARAMGYTVYIEPKLSDLIVLQVGIKKQREKKWEAIMAINRQARGL